MKLIKLLFWPHIKMMKYIQKKLKETPLDKLSDFIHFKMKAILALYFVVWMIVGLLFNIPILMLVYIFSMWFIPDDWFEE